MPELTATRPAASVSPHTRQCTVQLLDDIAVTISFKKTDMGSTVFNQVCEELNLVEKDYFGLRFMDQNLHRYWLDPAKPVLKQVKGTESIVFAFRVKFYPEDPSILKEEYTRYLLVLQLRRDLLHGRLHCPQNDLANLAAYIIQGELGDFDPNDHVGNYVSQFKILLNQSPKVEEKIATAHKTLKGQTPAEADLNFLKKAASLDTYGYYPYTIKDSKAGQVYLGATPNGIIIYQTSRKLHHLNWAAIDGVDYSGREFLIYPKRSYWEENSFEPDGIIMNTTNGSAPVATTNERPASVISVAKSQMSETHKESRRKPSIKFFCPSSSYSKQLWKYMLAEQAFFTSVKSYTIKPIVKRSLLFRNSTFRWHPANRVLEELKEADAPHRECPSFERSHVPRQMNRDDRSAPWANKFHTLPSRSKNPLSDDAVVRALSAEAPELGAVLRSSTLLPRDDSAYSAVIETVDHPSPSVSPTAMAGGVQESPTATVNCLTNATATPRRIADQQPVTSTPKVDGLSALCEFTKQNNVMPLSSPQSLRQTSPSTMTATSLNAANCCNNVGGRVTSSFSPCKSSKSSANLFSAFLRSCFLALLFAIILCGIVVVVMETDHLRAHLDGNVFAHDFRRQFYTPARRFVVEQAAKWSK